MSSSNYARFKVGQPSSKWIIARFNPDGAESSATNHQGRICYYRAGAWYVPLNGGIPANHVSSERIWGIPAFVQAKEALAKADGTAETPVITPEVAKAAGLNPKDAVGQKKAPLHLIPVAALAAEAAAFRDGVRKYGAANWRITGVQASIYIAAALRHISLWYDGGEDVASDSKVKHLGHARACLGIVLDAEACGTLTDDRPPAVPGLEAILAGLGA